MFRLSGMAVRRASSCTAMLLVAAFGGRVALAAVADNVAGNLINFNNTGAWSWYMDERAIVDPTNGTLLISSNTSGPVAYPTGRPVGADDVVTYNFTTGSRSRFQLGTLSVDDHDAAALTILPNGKYLAMYSNHGNTNMGDYLSRYRVSNNPHDSSSWTAEQSFNWQTVTGWNTAPNPNNRVSYHNLYYLSDFDQVYDFSRGTHQSANSLLFNYSTNTPTWGGQLTTSSVGGYSTGYIKYASNGKDRIYFISTETHPRNYNNNMWSGYISGDKSYDMNGNVIDSNIFNNEDTAGVGAVSDIGSFTQIQAADPLGAGQNRQWSTDLALDANGNPYALYTSRFNSSLADDTAAADHRITYARFDGTTWLHYEVARMGPRLFQPEEDYTGNGALVPGDPNTIYVSTPYDPRDPTGATLTPKHEIYKGVTSTGGASWSWTPITQNSSVDNLRPIIPAWDSTHTAVVWFRGTYTNAQNIDAAVVGLVDKHVDEQVGLVHYVDATTGAGGNTTLSNGNPVSGWTTSATTGNGGSVLQATSNLTALKTTLTGLANGKYDIFGYFWADQTNDLRIQFGFDTTHMQLYRRNGSQQAEAGQFDSAVTLSGGGTNLYRAYLGRVTVSGGSSVSAIIDDFATTTTNRAWYDGLGYALVSLAGDYNHNGIVDAGDYTIWRDTLGQNVYADSGADGNGNGVIDQGDYDMWTSHFGQSGPGAGSGATASVPEPAAGLLFIVGATAWLLGRRNRR